MILALLGWLGTALVVGAYLLLSLGRLKPGAPYQLANFAGSTLVGISAATAGLWSVVALQVAWTLISAAALLRKADLRCAARESGGFRCERLRWPHLGGHSCRQALLRIYGVPAGRPDGKR